MAKETTAAGTVMGVAPMLTPEDVGRLIGKSGRFVRERLLKTGALRGVRFGGNCWRVRVEDYERMVATGATGARHARPSGGRRGGAA